MRIKGVLILILFLSGLSVRAEQRTRLDLDSLYNVTFALVGVDIDKAQLEANKYYRISFRYGDSLNLAYALDLKGLSSYHADKMDSAFYYGNKSIELFRKLATDSFGLSTAIYNRSLYDEYLGSYKTALRALHLSREIDIKNKDKNGSDIFYYFRLADIVFYQGNPELALRYLHRSWRALKKEKFYDFITAAILIDFAWTYLELDLEQEAQRYALWAYKQALKNKEQSIRSGALQVFAKIESKKGNHELALNYARKALAYDEEYGDPYTIVYSKSFLATLLYSAGNKEEADELFQFVGASFQDYPDPIMHIEVGKELYDYYKSIGNNKLALEYLEVVNAEQERINKVDGLAAMRQFDEELENRKKELAKTKSQMQEEELQFKNILLIIAVLIIASLVVIGIIFLQGLSKIKAAKVELENRNIEIHKQSGLIQKTSEELQAQNIALDKLNRSKDRLFSILTHDLRQPFNQIISVVDLMEQDALDTDSKHELTKELRNSVNSTSDLVSNVLLWSKAQFAGVTINPKNLPLANAVKRSLLHFSLAFEKKEISLELNISDKQAIVFDPDHFASVCRNVISNAFKFSPVGGKISIWSELSMDYILLKIKDQGMGMDQYQVDNLLEARNKESLPGTLNEDGTGIGMTIIRDFLKENSAFYDIQSTLGEGTTFILKLPIGEKINLDKSEGIKGMKSFNVYQ